MPRRDRLTAGPRHRRRVGARHPPEQSGSRFIISCRSLRAGIAMAKVSARKFTSRKPAGRKKSASRRWSARVTRESDALDLKRGVFTGRDPKRIAASQKRSAERSHRRKSDPYRSAQSMLTFYINRAGKNLLAGRRKTLQRAKIELRKQFGRE
jgi:hypothetical protein